jgi:hypothetical protein
MKTAGKLLAVVVLLLFVLSRAAWAAVPVGTVWEVRFTNGVDTNGGGFYSAEVNAGTDWSQANSPQYAVTDAVTAGSTSITSATANFGTDVVGNVLYIQGGTAPITAGWYEIVSRTNSTTIVVDRSTGLSVGTGATLNIGGALKTMSALNTGMVAGNKAFCKGESGTTQTATVTFAQNVNSGTGPLTSQANTRLIGYGTTRNDGVQALITLSTNTGLFGIKGTGEGLNVYNFNVNCASLGTSTGIFLGPQSIVHNCKVSNATSVGIDTNGGDFQLIHRCEVTGCSGTAAVRLTNNYCGIVESNVHDNTTIGVYNFINGGGFCISNLITNNTGATTDGVVNLSSSGFIVLGNVIHGSGRYGINLGTSNTQLNTLLWSLIKNNSISNNAGGGILGGKSIGIAAEPWYDGNAFGYPANGGFGARSNLDNTGVGVTATDLAMDSVSNTKVSSNTYTFNLGNVGWYLHVTSGTGWTPGYYLVLSNSGNTLTLASSPAAINTTGGHFTLAINTQDGVNPYTNVFDQTVTVGSQYVSAVSSGNAGNWALNNTTNQGSLLQYAGQPQTWPGNTGTTNGYPSIGVQYKSTGGGGAILSRVRTMTQNERQSDDYHARLTRQVESWRLALCP